MVGLAILLRADPPVRRLPPSAFTSTLPPAIVLDLKRRACSIPQTAFSKSPENVISGSFEKPGQNDWAVLCSVSGKSSILIYWGGSRAEVAQIALGPDSPLRLIRPVGAKFILEHYRAYGGTKPPTLIDHAGIDDALVEKGSVVHYRYHGGWLRLSGSD